MSDPKTVLIVEDEKNIVDILRFNLQRAGYQTLEAYDGEDGLAQAVSANPDLILLDVMLPKKNGFDVCRALRDQGSSVPVIILTAREEEADKVLGLETVSYTHLRALLYAGAGGPGRSQHPADHHDAAGCRLCRGLRHARVRGFVYQYRQPPGLPGR